MKKTVTMAHGAGGRQTSELIRSVFQRYFDNPYFTADDAAILSPGSGTADSARVNSAADSSAEPPAGGGRLAMSTDSFIVSPWEFPGGNIGKLSVCGTVNDLACMGAKPLYLTCAFVIEEGFPFENLEKIAASMAETAEKAGVKIVAGDTKVAGRGQADSVFITTTGLGAVQEGAHLSGAFAVPGDAVLVTGDLGRHGCTILLEREQLGIEADIKSDCAPLWGTVEAMLAVSKRIHVIRDATRGGAGTVLYEIAEESQVGIRLDEPAVPVDPAVRGVCGLLGLNPLYLANEGTMVVIAPKEEAKKLLSVLKEGEYSKHAAIIGEVTADHAGQVVVTTEIGAQTLLPQPGGELLPRIC